jgi:hypothetical protein
MKAKHVSGLLAVLLLLALPTLLSAENGAYAGSGGTFSTGTTAGQSISATAVPLTGTAASVSISCPITFFGAGTYQWNWQCAGGSITIASTDNSVVMKGTFASGTMTFSGSGGGRGGNVSYWYQFTGSFSSRVQLKGTGQGALGSVSFAVHTTSQLGSASAPVTSLNLGWNSRYSPVVVASGGNARLLLADNLTGENLASYGSWGSGTGQFENIAGLAHDLTGRIYVSDSSLDRLVRIDDMTGANWLQLGSSGSGALQFSGPAGVAIDSSGKIWIADAGNNRIVRFDDMSGTNWTAFGAAGSGANQFSNPSAIAFDHQGRIYVADSGNGRLVRFDDLTGKNWTTLSTIPIGVYAYSLAYVNGVAIEPSGKIIASIAGGNLYRIDDMTGANGEAGSWGTSIAGISADPAGTVYVASSLTPGFAQALDAVGTGYFSGAMGQGSLQLSAVLAMATSAVPPPVPIISTSAMAFANQNVGEPSGAKHVVLSNIGRGPLPISSVAADADFKVTNPCPASVAGGTSCSIAVQFDPTSTGSKSAQLSFTTTTSVHPVLETSLTGTGTAPNGVIFPGSIGFNPQQTTTTSGTQLAILTNTGTGPLNITSITASGGFAVSHNCPAAVAPGNGCTLQVAFSPSATGPISGSINIVDDNVPGGTTQQIQLTGTGAAAAPGLTLAPQGLFFPDQQVGVTSVAQTLTLSNGSTSAVSLSAPVFAAGFTGSTNCGTSLAAGKSCGIQVKFAPTAPGSLSGAVSIPVTGQMALSAGVAGTGVNSTTPVLVATPSPAAFGVYVVGDNPSMNMTVKNPKGYPAGIRSMSLSSSAVFSVTGNNCPAILTGGASCTVQFTFTPTQVTSYSATWTLTETSGAKLPISVTGSGGTDGGGN